LAGGGGTVFIRIAAEGVSAVSVLGRIRQNIRDMAKDAARAEREFVRMRNAFGKGLLLGGVSYGLTKAMKPGIREAANLQEVLQNISAEWANLDAGTRKISLGRIQKEAERVQAFATGGAKEMAEIAAIMVRSGVSEIAVTQKGAMEAAAALGTLNRELSYEAAAPIIVQTAAMVKTDDYKRVVQSLEAAKSISPLNVLETFAGLEDFAALASDFGDSIETMVAALASLKNQGVKGAEAGTAIRMFYANLLDPSRRKYLRRLGVEVYDAKGQLKGMNELIPQFQKGLAKLSPAKQKQILIKIFEKEQFARVIRLFDQGEFSVENMKKRLAEAPTYLQKLEEQMKSLNKRVQAMGGNIATTLAKIFDPITPDLAEATHAIDGLITKTREFIAEHPGINKGLAYTLPAAAVAAGGGALAYGIKGLLHGRNLAGLLKGNLFRTLLGRTRSITVELAQAKALEAAGVEAQKVFVLNWPAGLDRGALGGGVLGGPAGGGMIGAPVAVTTTEVARLGSRLKSLGKGALAASGPVAAIAAGFYGIAKLTEYSETKAREHWEKVWPKTERPTSTISGKPMNWREMINLYGSMEAALKEREGLKGRTFAPSTPESENELQRLVAAARNYTAPPATASDRVLARLEALSGLATRVDVNVTVTVDPESGKVLTKHQVERQLRRGEGL